MHNHVKEKYTDISCTLDHPGLGNFCALYLQIIERVARERETGQNHLGIPFNRAARAKPIAD